MEKEILQVNMFGEFSLTYGGATIDDSGSRSKKLWTLLEYLLVFRDREITQNELIEYCGLMKTFRIPPTH